MHGCVIVRRSEWRPVAAYIREISECTAPLRGGRDKRGSAGGGTKGGCGYVAARHGGACPGRGRNGISSVTAKLCERQVPRLTLGRCRSLGPGTHQPCLATFSAPAKATVLHCAIMSFSGQTIQIPPLPATPPRPSSGPPQPPFCCDRNGNTHPSTSRPPIYASRGLRCLPPRLPLPLRHVPPGIFCWPLLLVLPTARASTSTREHLACAPQDVLRGPALSALLR